MLYFLFFFLLQDVLHTNNQTLLPVDRINFAMANPILSTQFLNFLNKSLLLFSGLKDQFDIGDLSNKLFAAVCLEF